MREQSKFFPLFIVYFFIAFLLLFLFLNVVNLLIILPITIPSITPIEENVKVFPAFTFLLDWLWLVILVVLWGGWSFHEVFRFNLIFNLLFTILAIISYLGHEQFTELKFLANIVDQIFLVFLLIAFAKIMIESFYKQIIN